MRYRNISQLLARIPADWLTKSQDLLTQMQSETTIEARKEIIASNADHWTKLRKDFADLSYNKCWYSEKKLTETEMEIDHFRPKGKVYQENHDGYWWLAFDYRNFRLSSRTCNCKRKNTFVGDEEVFGKGTNFPLQADSIRETDHLISLDANTFQLGNERIKLLDPIQPEDIQLIDYDFTNGKTIISSNPDIATELNRLRVSESVKTYNLDSSNLLPERLKISRNINKLIGDVLALQNSPISDEEKKAKRLDIKARIGEKINDSSEFSLYGRRYIASLVNMHPWLLDVLTGY